MHRATARARAGWNWAPSGNLRTSDGSAHLKERALPSPAGEAHRRRWTCQDCAGAGASPMTWPLEPAGAKSALPQDARLLREHRHCQRRPACFPPAGLSMFAPDILGRLAAAPLSFMTERSSKALRLVRAQAALWDASEEDLGQSSRQTSKRRAGAMLRSALCFVESNGSPAQDRFNGYRCWPVFGRRCRDCLRPLSSEPVRIPAWA